MSFSSRFSSMVEKNVTAEELGTSESAPPPLDIILPVVLLAFFLVVLIAWRYVGKIYNRSSTFILTLCDSLTTCLISRCWKAKGDVEDKNPLLERSITNQMRTEGLEAAITN